MSSESKAEKKCSDVTRSVVVFQTTDVILSAYHHSKLKNAEKLQDNINNEKFFPHFEEKGCDSWWKSND